MRRDRDVEDVDGDFPPEDGRVVGDDDDDDFPFREKLRRHEAEPI